MAQFNFAEKSEIEECHIEPTDVMTGDRNKSRYLLYQLRLSMARAKQIDIIVSFLMESGVRMLLSDLKAALQRGVRIRILTGNYLGITQPSALYLLKKELGDKVELRFYSDKGRSFHPKSYIFHYDNMSEIYIGSSNISRSALTSGIEWNYRFNNNQDSQNFNLEQQIKTIFTFQFLQNANTEWKQQSLAELSEMYQPKTISGKDLIADGNYFVYGANGIIGKYNQYNHSESEIAVACRGASCGSIQMTLPFSWITGNAMVVKPHSDFPYREYLYYYLLAKNPNYLCSGSAQPQLTRENLTLYSLKVPSTTELNAFESYAGKVRKIIIKNQQENIELSTLRDWLLPMLMNGQATISD